MRILIACLWLAGFVQLGIVAANFVLPKKLSYRENLAQLSPILRQIFVIHSVYVTGVVFLFALLTFGFAPDLISGHGLGRFLAAAMAVFWLFRIPIQLFYYDASLRRANRAGDVAMTLALLFLGFTYATAALVRRALAFPACSLGRNF